MQKQNFHRFLNLPIFLEKPAELGKSQEVDLFRKYFKEVDPLKNFLKSKNLEILYVDSLNTPPFSSLPIHSDFNNDYQQGVTINISFGGDDSGMRWYTYSDQNAVIDVKTTKTDIQYRQFVREMCTEVYRSHTNKLSLINIAPPHDTFNNHEFNRWTIRVGVGMKDQTQLLTWSQALSIFSDFVE